MSNGARRPLRAREIATTAEFIAAQQERDGAMPWFKGGKLDPWDHVQGAMGLALTGQYDRAEAAFQHLVDTQETDGAWAASRS